jgi:hypothetical protein
MVALPTSVVVDQRLSHLHRKMTGKLEEREGDTILTNQPSSKQRAVCVDLRIGASQTLVHVGLMHHVLDVSMPGSRSRARIIIPYMVYQFTNWCLILQSVLLSPPSHPSARLLVDVNSITYKPFHSHS